MISLSRRHLLMQAGLASFSLLPWRSPVAMAALDNINFTAYRNGSWFGSHNVTFEENEGKLNIDIEISFDYKLAFLSLYRYRHRNREVWADDRLIEIKTETDDNGTAFEVVGRAQDDRLMIDGSGGKLNLAGDTAPTSYWNEATVERGKWLDTQNGKLVQSKVTAKGPEPILVNGKTVEANAYMLEGDITCTLWYRERRWVGLKFIASDDSVIDYTIEPIGKNG